jgi:transcriptional regulator with XRE-family HTH domain
MPEVAFNIGAGIRGDGQHVAHPISSHDAQVGHRIRRQRLLMGLSQARMASALGISEELLESYEAGRTWVDLVSLMEIADVLGVDINFFNHGPSGRGGSASASHSGSHISRGEGALGAGNPIFPSKMRLRWLG